MGGRSDCFKIGTSFTARRWLSLNPCGFVGISFSFAFLMFAFAVTAQHLTSGSLFSQAIFILLYLPLSFMAVWSLYMAWTTNPGAVPMGARPLVTVRRAASGEMSPSVQTRKRGMRRCNKCNDNYKPNRAHHDSVTGRCIVKFDHYCPWVCNAVGAMNHKFFVLFVFYTMNTCLTSIFMIVIRAVRCGYQEANDDDDTTQMKINAAIMPSTNTTTTTDAEISSSSGDLDNGRWLQLAPTKYIHPECEDFHSTYTVVILFCVAVTFLIFTACMLVEQIEAIQTNQGKIARMKMRVGQGGTELRRVTDEFNEMFGGTSANVAWHWFVPLPVQFPGSYYKVVMGYEWDPTFDAVPYREGEPSEGSNSSASATSEPLSSSTADGDGSNNVVPPDIETGLAPETMDGVALEACDSPSVSVASMGSASLKKRSVASRSTSPSITGPSSGDALPEVS